MAAALPFLFRRGVGAFAPEQLIPLTDPPQGAWPWGNAHRYGVADGLPGDFTYIAFTDNAGGIAVAIYDHAAGPPAIQSAIEHDGFAAADQHNSPALLLRTDGRLLAIYMPHAGPSAYRRVTVNPLTSDPTITGGWQAATNIDSQLGGEAYTYPDLHRFDDGIHLTFRVQDGAGNNWCESISTDEGATWSTLVNLCYGPRYYARFFRSSGTRLDIAITDGSYAEDHASIHHFYRESGSYFKTDGTPIAGSPPFAISAFTKVYDGATAGVRSPADIVKIGDDIAIAFCVQTGTPHDHIGEDEDYKYARSNAGGAWAVSTVATAVGALTFEFTEGSLAIDLRNLSRLAVSRREVSDLSHPFRMFDVKSPDGGATWPGGTPISDSDGNPAAYAVFIRNYARGLRLAFLQGPTWTSQSVFSSGIVGFGATAG